MQRARAIALREGGMSYRAIGEALGVSKQMAHRHVRRALEDVTAKTRDSAERVRQLELLRLDALVRSHWAKRGEVDHARLLLSVSARRARLEGLDAPDRVEATGAGGAPLHPVPEPAELDLEKLSVTELRELDALLKRAGGGGGSGAGSPPTA